MRTRSTRTSPRRGRTPRRCRSCARRAPGSSGASRCTRTTSAAGSTAIPTSRRRRRVTGRGGTADWRHLDSFDVLSMPDPWEYPWFAAWDLAFHTVVWAHIDPAFAKYQLVVLLREWFLHPNGALPSYEWSFDDVNPPVHAMAAARVFRIDGGRDRDFLERVFQKLLLNFTWWLNRQDPDGNNVFGGGFLGLDNISPLDRSHLPPGHTLEEADGTAWMAFYALTMLAIAVELSEENAVYDDMVVKFLEQFQLIVRAAQRAGALRRRGGILLRPAGQRRRPRDRREGADDRRDDPAAAGHHRPAADDRARRAAREALRPRPGALGPRRPEHGRARAPAPGGAVGLDLGAGARAAAAGAALVLRRGRVPLALRAPLGLEALPGEPVQRPRRARRDDRLRAGRVDDADVRRQLQLARAGLVPRQLPSCPLARAVPRRLRRRVHARVPDGLGPAVDAARDRAGPRRPARVHLAARPGRAAAGLRRRREAPGRTRPGATTCSSSSTSTATTAPGLGAMHQTGWTALVADLILDPPLAR